jgi:hypothetical protein
METLPTLRLLGGLKIAPSQGRHNTVTRARLRSHNTEACTLQSCRRISLSLASHSHSVHTAGANHLPLVGPVVSQIIRGSSTARPFYLCTASLVGTADFHSAWGITIYRQRVKKWEISEATVNHREYT